MAKTYTLQELEAMETPKKTYSAEELMAIEAAPDDEVPWYKDVSLKGIAKGATEALPFAGGLAGAAFGGPLGGMLGAGAGKAAENLIEGTLLDEPKTSYEIANEPIGEIAAAGAGEMIVPMAGKAVDFGSKVLKGVSSSLSKVPAKTMETYFERTGDVESIANLADKADEIRQKALKTIDSFKGIQNSRIDEAIESTGNALVDVSDAKKALQDNINKLNPKINKDHVATIKEQLDLLNELAPDGKMPAKDAFEMQKRFQELAEYLPPGQNLKRKNFADITLARGASKLRQVVNKVAPEIGRANSEIASLRRLDKNLNKNLITPEKPFEALIGAGSGRNQQAARMLGKVDKIAGTDLVKEAEDLAAARYFNEAGILPGETTGSSLAPFATGGMAFAASGGDPKYLALGALSSPLAIKHAIKGASKLKNISPYLANTLEAITPRIGQSYLSETLSEKAKRINEERKAAKQLLGQ